MWRGRVGTGYAQCRFRRVVTCCPRVPCLPEVGKPRGQRVLTLRELVSPSPKGSLKRVGINVHPTENGMARINSCA